ncbi:MAG: 5-oxoprolinase/urea amidolyase family protein [Burkholderiaceae bacterium]|nr:urea amidolyase family protein [Burkholderiaceae bacterium]MCP5219122.1 5-oxoprolinase/urea amidolyase family protein [Burkholderiaceae bacterium]
MRFLPVNPRALLVELDDLEQTLALLASLQRAPIAGIDEIVPAARTLLLHLQPGEPDVAALAHALAQRDISGPVEQDGPRIEIPVRYDGEDLAEVAALLGITPTELIARHTGQDYTVAFCGFAPGFAYLSGGHPSLNVPRRATPRTRVPAGSVALAGTFAAVYPDATPGGWQLLGTTDLKMWDLARDPPALLQPGMRVHFVDETTKSIADGAYPTRASGQKTLKSTSGATPPDDGRPALIVQASGLQTLVQDAGRPGLAAQGVSAAGALDAGAMRRANRLVGNASNQPVLEALAGGLQLTSQGDTVLAVTGATGALMLSRADGRTWPVERNQALALAAGDTLMLGQPATGLRSYVAVRGGFVIAPVLGSASRDTLAKIGPPALTAGQHLPVGDTRACSAVATPDLAPPPLPKAGDTVTLDVTLGPRTDWFTPEAVTLLAAQRWQLTQQADRVGLRLQGEVPLTRAQTQELPSEGTVTGAIQVPANGQPVLFLADHPLTGGYPVIGCVAPWHLDLAAQIPPGAWIQFKPLAPFAEIQGTPE